MPAINVCAMECACFGTKSMLYTYRQRSISTLFPEIVLLLLDFQHGMLSICHHLQSTARNLIRSDLLCWLSHPARCVKKLRMKQKMKSNTKWKIFIENSKQFFSFALKAQCLSASSHMHAEDDCMCRKLFTAKYLKLPVKYKQFRAMTTGAREGEWKKLRRVSDIEHRILWIMNDVLWELS